jgi:hypothetical protein
MKYRIKFFSGFCSTEECKRVFEKICQVELMDNYGPEKDIFIVTDDSYTHAIIINTAMPNLNIPKENVIGLAYEPPAFMTPNTRDFITYLENNVSKYFIGDNSGLPLPFVSRHCYQWYGTPTEIMPIKNKMMSIMVSQKTEAPGHRYRHELVKAILGSELNIDIYGRGCPLYNDHRVKGSFDTDSVMFENYYFHICIENFSLPDYTSEKYMNPLLLGTTPIYWGAKNELFPEYTIRLSGDVIKDMDLLHKIWNNPFEYKREISQEIVRNKLNLLKNLDTVFS